MRGDTFRRLRLMLRARRFNEKLLDHLDLSPTPIISAVGYESSAVAIAMSWQPGDAVLLGHRNNHVLPAMGSDLAELFSECFGRDLSPQRGRGGPWHLADREHGVFWSSALIAGAVPLAVGLALGFQRQGAGVAFCVFGDGAMGEGVVSECFNFASLNRLPIVFVCENNTPEQLGTDIYTTMPQEMMEHAAAALTDIPSVYRIASSRVHATSPAATGDAMIRATALARGGAPQFIEVVTAPWPMEMIGVTPHKPDGDTDLSAATRSSEPGSWNALDPVLQEVRDLLAADVSIDEILAIDASVQDDVDAALATAAAAPLAPQSAAFADIWASA